MNQLKIKYAPLDKFKVNERNARVHSEDQVARLAAGIEAFGFNVPVAIDAEGTLIYGHARLAAAQKAGLEKIPFVELTHMTEEQKRAFVLADNQIANMATWDFDLLGGELSALAETDFDIDIIGWTGDEIKDILGLAEEIASMPDLIEGDQGPLRQITITVHESQLPKIRDAIEKAKALGPFEEIDGVSINSNAIARIAERFLSWAPEHADS